ncbi:MAG: hypothetical protein JNK87_05465 [Bryobacterales bacterium]|nr:hypothetical protein [Bryobacterales bacterium]
MAAIQALVSLQAAQAQSLSRQGNYAGSLAELGPQGLALIPQDLANGTRHGYQFQISAQPTDYRLYATPIPFPKTGRRSSYTDATLIIRENWGTVCVGAAEPAGPGSPEIR